VRCVAACRCQVCLCCSVLPCFALCCRVLPCAAVRCSVCCIVLLCVAMCCSVRCSVECCCQEVLHGGKGGESRIERKRKRKSNCREREREGARPLWVSFAKEPYKRDDILQKNPIILRNLQRARREGVRYRPLTRSMTREGTRCCWLTVAITFMERSSELPGDTESTCKHLFFFVCFCAKDISRACERVSEFTGSIERVRGSANPPKERQRIRV